jgi:hypothetical protein
MPRKKSNKVVLAARVSEAEFKAVEDLAARHQVWTGEARPTPTGPPRSPHVAVTRPLVFQPPQTKPPSILKPTPAPCPICMERQMRYQRAIETGMGAGSTNLRELPQMFAPVSTPQATPAPLVLQEAAP